MRSLTTAAACLAAAVSLVACGGQSVTFSESTTVPTVSVATGPSQTGTGTGASAATTPSGTTTPRKASVPIDRIVGPEGVNFEVNPVLAPTPATLTGAAIDGIECQTLRQLAYEANSHLQVYVDGKARGLPGGIGMVQPSLDRTAKGPLFKASTCYYWLHTLTQDGVIHVEAPLSKRFTLGQLFAIWRQPLSHSRVATASGTVTAIVNGHRFTGDPQRIPLTEHSSIELAVGSPVPRFKAVDWSTSGL